MTTSKFITLEQKDIVRFMSYVQVDNDSGAWLWTGGKTASGYGAFWLNGSTVSAHRVSWTIKHGDIPPGLFVCHKHEHLGRHNVNPVHLFLGSGFDNMRDASVKGRLPTGTENKSSKLTECEALAIYRDQRTMAVISREMGVSQPIVSKIKRGELWASVTGAERASTHSLRNKSGYRGVSWAKNNNKWLAGIVYKDVAGEAKSKYLGLFACPIEAAKAYDSAALEIHGGKARLNFPQSATAQPSSSGA
jgi:hypothetical protein